MVSVRERLLPSTRYYEYCQTTILIMNGILYLSTAGASMV